VHRPRPRPRDREHVPFAQHPFELAHAAVVEFIAERVTNSFTVAERERPPI
jgi:hypothetical protein